MLTKGLDNVPGTSGNDTIIGSIDTAAGGSTPNAELVTLTSSDIINGGAGVDTLKIAHSGTQNTTTLGNLSNVEIVEIESSSTGGVTVDSSNVAGVTNLNVTKAAGAVSATGAATTDVSVKLDAPATIPVTVNGGNNANVTLTGAGAAGTLNAITVGNTKAAQGDVTVAVTNAAAVKGTDITAVTTTAITGGKTVTVTQKAGDASALVADGATTTTHAQNNVSITSDANTSTVTVKQDKTVVADAGKVAVAGVAEVASVKFTALAGTVGTPAAVTVGGLTFTTTKALTAAEVAQAFADLSASALKPGTAVGDTQGAGIAANGVFTGSLLAGWNSSAAAADTVTFTASKGGAMTPLTATGATVTLVTDGVDAVAAKGATLGVTAGTVNIAGGAALKNVTVDGYNASGNGISGTANALENLSLSNGGAFNAAVGAATVNLSLENVWATAAVAATSTTGASAAGAAAVSVGSATTTTLNVKNTGANAVTLTSTATALNVNGSDTLTAVGSTLTSLKTIKVTETAGLNLGTTTLTNVESVDTTGTTGAVTVAIDGTKATYAGGAGVDTVSVTGTAGAVDKAINLGAGNDSLNLSTLTAVPAIKAGLVIEGGDGTDTLVLKAVDAATLSAGPAFEAQINGFEKLEVAVAGAATTVDLDNLDDINYVISNGSTAGALKLDKMLNNATVELKANHVAGIEVALKDATGTADAVNLVANAATTTDIGLVTVAGVETINVTANDTDVSTTVAVSTNTLTLKADTAATVNVTGAGNLVLNLDAASVKVASVDASAATGSLTVDLATQSSGVAVTVTGGAGKDTLKASDGATAKADVLVGGAGDDILHAGSNGAKLTGGAGNDLFVVSVGNKEAHTYTSITDFQAGDLLQLTGATSFGKLAATLNAETAVFSDYVTAAMEQAESAAFAGAHDAVWFSFNGNSYVVVEQDTNVGFTNGADTVVQLAGVANLDTASFNSQFFTVSL